MNCQRCGAARFTRASRPVLKPHPYCHACSASVSGVVAQLACSGMTFDEIAVETGLTPRAVQARLRRR